MIRPSNWNIAYVFLNINNRVLLMFQSIKQNAAKINKNHSDPLRAVNREIIYLQGNDRNLPVCRDDEMFNYRTLFMFLLNRCNVFFYLSIAINGLQILYFFVEVQCLYRFCCRFPWSQLCWLVQNLRIDFRTNARVRAINSDLFLKMGSSEIGNIRKCVLCRKFMVFAVLKQITYWLVNLV